MTAMLIGTALALAALLYVLFPLFRETLELAPAWPRAVAAMERGGGEAVDALREIEFDRATGKLSDRDYEQLKAVYTQRAVAAMRLRESGAAVCEVCGPRPEVDPVFCSSCGRRLAL